MPEEALITGIGLASSLGEGLEAHWDALQSGRVNVDGEKFAPFVVHPLAPLNYDLQIAKKGDQRQMEAWQRIGTYAAGLALDCAGIKGNAEILGRTDMIVAAGGGERDLNVDSTILSAQQGGETAPGFLNERLMSDLRPTLFLAQLSNLLAGNISIVHGVTGSSRTFMGEEASGVDAVRIALARIEAGQSDIALVGAAFNAERKEMLMLFDFGGYALKGDCKPVWDRAAKGGFALGSAGVFLVIESKKHATARGAKPLAKLSSVVADHARRNQGPIAPTLEKLWGKIAPKADAAIVTCATGAEPVTAQERAFLAAHADHAVRAIGTPFGHTVEAQFPLGIAVAALSLSHGALFPPQGGKQGGGVEKPSTGALSQVAVVCAGHWRGEGMALLDRA
jgi:3-oxoacyl-[acyl-carrier-protein] synthase II